MGSRIGFFMFAGLMIGAYLGQKFTFQPYLVAVGGALLGVVLALVLDHFANKKADAKKDASKD